MSDICPACACPAHESRFGAPCYACVPPASKHSWLEPYLLSYPLTVMQPKSMLYLMNVESGGSAVPAYNGPPRERLLRLIALIQSADPRQRKRGMRLANAELRQ